MPNYNLSGLSSDSFEQLIQALSLKVIGPGGVIFGSGPDGAREATFDGRMSYPSLADPWQGYLVVQAKFLQKPTCAPDKDGKWLLNALTAELSKFADAKRRLKQPDYYILCTNVVLTPAWELGTKDRAFELYRKAGTDLKGFDVWDGDKLARLLDDATEIQRTYAAWIQPGDVLAAALEWIGGLQPDFEKAIVNYLQKQLIRDHYLRLDQSGHAAGAETKVAVERVFVDLTASAQPTNDPPDEGTDESKLQAGVVSALLARGATKWNRQADQQRPGFERAASAQERTGRVVLVGGPGQGKSTTGQYLCQLYRVSILRARPQLDQRAIEVIEAIEAQCEQEFLEIPGARRYPVRIELKDFAAAIAGPQEGGPHNLLEYIADSIKRLTSYAVSAQDLRKWLAAYPWALVLDGLDEVPASANRGEVIDCINDFLVDLSDENSDILILATTRPQGYKGDLRAQIFEHLHLTPLSLPRAMRCARRFAAAHMAEEEQERVIAELSAASENDATARLMRSPLQVTILATLAATGPVPQDRWRLFSDYYRVIYRREAAKRIWKVLETNQEDIDAIHNTTGLVLQIECERSGKTDSRLARTKFEAIVEQRLQSEGCKAENLRGLRDQIVEASGDRLVFLVGVEADQVGFEIRSLQEFMAARALLDGNEETVLSRLDAIAPISHWRNVFVFTAAHCFTEKQYLRQNIVGICATLNQSDDASKLALTGSQLALDLLEAGVASQQSKFRETLTYEACKLLDRPGEDFHGKISRLGSAFDRQLKIEIERRLPLPSLVLGDEGAWCALLNAAIFGNYKWAWDLVSQYWPEDPRRQLQSLSLCAPNGATEGAAAWWCNKLDECLWLVSPSDWRWLRSSLTHNLALNKFSARSGSAMVLLGLRGWRNEPLCSVVSLGNSWRAWSVLLRGGPEHWLTPLSDIETNEPACKVLRRCAAFVAAPSPNLLSSVLTEVANDWPVSLPPYVLFSLPWPLESLLRRCADPQVARELAERAGSGQFGDATDWFAAESRWAAGKIGVADIAAWDKHDCLPGAYLRNEGFSVAGIDPVATAFDPPIHAAYHGTELAGLFERSKSAHLRDILGSGLLHFLSTAVDVEFKPSVETVDSWLTASSQCFVVLDQLVRVGWSPDDRLAIYELLCMKAKLFCFQPSQEDIGFVLENFVMQPESSPLVGMLACWARQGRQFVLPRTAIDKLWGRQERCCEAATIMAVQPLLTANEARRLSNWFATFDAPDYEWSNFLGAAAAESAPEAAAMELALAACEALRTSSAENRASAMELLDSVLLRRKSSLSDRLACERLGLTSAV